MHLAGPEMIVVSREGTHKNVGLITLNRPKALNALCSPLMAEVAVALDEFQADPAIGAVVITGSEKVSQGGGVAFHTYG